MNDRSKGGLMLIGASVFFVYYTIWAILLPLLDDSSPIHDFFPPREWAIRIPALLLVLGLSAIGCTLGLSMVQQAHGNRQKKSL